MVAQLVIFLSKHCHPRCSALWCCCQAIMTATSPKMFAETTGYMCYHDIMYAISNRVLSVLQVSLCWHLQRLKFLRCTFSECILVWFCWVPAMPWYCCLSCYLFLDLRNGRVLFSWHKRASFFIGVCFVHVWMPVCLINHDRNISDKLLVSVFLIG